MKKTTQNILSESMLFCAIYFTSLILRFIKLILDPIMMRDAALYINLSEKWFITGNYSSTLTNSIIIPPLPLYATKELMRSGLSAEISGRSISMFLACMIPFLGYKIALYILRDKTKALICVGLFIIHPTLITYSTQPLRENFYLFFFGLTALEAVIWAVNESLYNLFFCGVCFICCLFCRYESLELSLILPFAIISVGIIKKHSIKRITTSLFVLFIGVIASFASLFHTTGYNVSFLKKISLYQDVLLDFIR